MKLPSLTMLVFGSILGLSSIAAADAKINLTVSPKTVHPGDALVVTVTGAAEMPKGHAGGKPLVFWKMKSGYQAVYGTALDVNEDHILVELDAGAKPISVPVVIRKFPETKLIVEDELANPDKDDRDKIDADNGAMIAAYAKSDDVPMFMHPFKRPSGKMTSGFGEWRTFNDGHRSQHLGMDVSAREGSKIGAVDDGTVVLVRETFLAGNIVEVAHGAGISSLYFHLSKASVAEGDKVVAGQEIGRAGHTGRTTGAHLHISIHVPGGMVDPAAFFKLPIKPAMTR